MDTLKLKIDELLRIKRWNLGMFLSIIFISILGVLWAFFNNDIDSLGEKIFFTTNFYVIGTSIYVFYAYARILPKPAKQDFDSLFSYQKNMVLRTFKANRVFQLGYVQMVMVSWMGIICLELPMNKNLPYYCLGIIFVMTLVILRSLYTKKWARKEFIRLTGEEFIPSI